MSKIPKPRPGKNALVAKSDTDGFLQNGIVVSDEYNQNLVGSKAIKIYDEMRSGDATIHAAFMAVKLPILSVRWYFEPASESKEDKEIAEFCSQALFEDPDYSWRETLEEILLYLIYGRMPFEVIYKFREDQMITLRKLQSIWPNTVYSWQLEDKSFGIVQLSNGGKFHVPGEKLCVFVNQKENNNWEGRSIFRSAYKHWYMKDKYYLIDAIATERQGVGIPYARHQSGLSESDKSDLREMLKNIRANQKAYLMFDEKVLEVGFMKTNGDSNKKAKDMIDHHNRQIVLNILAQFLDLGSNATGSYALSKDQSEFFLLAEEAIATHVAQITQKNLVKKLVDYNYTVQKYPTLKFEKIGSVDFTKLVEALTKLESAQIMQSDQEIVRYLRDAMDLPSYEGSDPDPMIVDEITLDIEMSLDELENGGQQQPDITQQAMEELSVHFAGYKGEPLSEETKRKISEALKQYWSKKSGGKSGKKKADPAIKEKRKEISKLRSEVRAMKDDFKRKLLEKKAKGEKLDDQERAKFELNIFNKSQAVKEKIDNLKIEIESLRESSKASETRLSRIVLKMSEALDRLYDKSKRS